MKFVSLTSVADKTDSKGPYIMAWIIMKTLVLQIL